MVRLMVAALVVALGLAGCSRMLREPPVVLFHQTLCLAFCVATLGNIREETVAGGDAAGGSLSLSQTATSSLGGL